MPFDQHKNLAIAVVAVAPSPPDTGLTLTVAAGHGARYPVPPFDVTIWLATKYPNPADAEVARCTAIAGDQLTLVRAQGGTTARLVQVGDLIAESITAQYLQSLEAAIGTTPSPPTLHAPTHAEGGTDPVQLTQSQVTGLTTSLTTIAGDITTLEGDVTNLQTIVTSGPVALHAPRHAVGGADPVTVTGLAGFPGGTANFLRADGTFALPPGGGAPAAHRLTHETGGSDALQNLAGGVITTGTVADARLTVNVLKFTGGYPGGTVNFLRADGTFATPAGSGGAPALHAATHTPGNTDTIPNVAWTNQANSFTALQTISNTDLTFSTTAKLRWGSAIASDPMLKRNGAAIEARTGNDGGATTFRALLVATDLTTGTMPFARIQLTASPRLLGRGTAAAGPMEEITLGTGLTMTGTVLSASGGGAPAAHHLTHEVGGSDQITGPMAFQSLLTTADVTVGADLKFTARSGGSIFNITGSTTDGADHNSLLLTPAGFPDPERGPWILMAGNDLVPLAGWIQIQTGNTPTAFVTITAPNNSTKWHPNGGVSFGSQIDPGAGNLGVAGQIQVGVPGAAGNVIVRPGTTFGADNKALFLQAGQFGFSGGQIALVGNEYGGALTGAVAFYTGGIQRGQMWPSGGFTWGTGTDPGGGAITAAGGARFTGLGFGPGSGPAGVEVCYSGKGFVQAYDRNLGSYQVLVIGGSTIEFMSPGGAVRGTMHSSGGFSWGSTVDPGAGSLRLETSLVFPNTDAIIRNDALDGADAWSLSIGGGSSAGADTARGGSIRVYGNQHASHSGKVRIYAGVEGTGQIEYAAGGSVRGIMHPSGGFSWGSATDPGPGSVHLTHPAAGGVNLFCAGPSAGTNYPIIFYNGGVQVGYINTSTTGTGYNTTSDARLKTDRGRLSDTSVLERTVVHLYDSRLPDGGTALRGVFAQEAAAVAPFAVTVGTDEINEQGQLTHPWGVDYSKYVPDLIVGWQRHEAELAELKAELALLRGSH